MPFTATKNISTLVRCALTAAAAGALVLTFHVPTLYFLPWFALVPFLYALRGCSLIAAYAMGLLFGMVLFIGILYWVVPFLQLANELSNWMALLLGFLYWLYCAQSFALLAVGLRWVGMGRKGCEWFFLPLLGTVITHHFPMVFPGDFSLTQSQFTLALQGIDLTGSIGLHFLILLHNGLLYDVIQSHCHKNAQRPYSGNDLTRVCAVITLCAWFVYGAFAYRYWHSAPETWQIARIGIVQTNDSPSIAIPDPQPGYTRAYPPALAMSEQLLDHDVDLIVWPESRYLGFHDFPHVRTAWLEFTRDSQVPLLVQEIRETGQRAYNSSLLILPDGTTQLYDKQKLIAFGEFMPFPELGTARGKLADKIFGDFSTEITAGEHTGPMNWKDWRFQVAICYELAHGDYIQQRFHNHDDNRPQWLIVQSNNTWFGASIQPELHAVAGQLRSVEQRIPIVHVINNGPSTYTQPSGRKAFQSERDTQASYLINIAVPPPGGGTWYGRYPTAFIAVIHILLLAALCSLWFRKTPRNPKGGHRQTK